VNKKPPPRDRLLKAAHLFYNEGIRAVGINRLLDEADTPIMSLYRNFGSKDALVEAYLERRHQRTQEQLDREVARRATTPRERILATYDVLAEVVFVDERYRGCAFINASVEMASPDHPLTQLAIRHKDAMLERFAREAREAGAPDPETLATQLLLLMDGAFVGSDMRRDPSIALQARAAASTLLDAALSSAAAPR
jgi:AcrR family transcriptional regulator